jgi:hypothetical protein
MDKRIDESQRQFRHCGEEENLLTQPRHQQPTKIPYVVTDLGYSTNENAIQYMICSKFPLHLF